MRPLSEQGLIRRVEKLEFMMWALEDIICDFAAELYERGEVKGNRELSLMVAHEEWHKYQETYPHPLNTDRGRQRMFETVAREVIE